jgi:hypothetical protein
MGQEPLGDRMEDRVERVVANPARARERDQRQRKPFAEHRHVAGAKERQRIRFHQPDVRVHLRGIVAGAGAIRAGNQDHLSVRMMHSRIHQICV